MRNLLNFIVRHSSFLLALFLIVFGFILLFKFNGYQRSVYLSSANGFSKELFSLSNSVSSFVNLKKTNNQLQDYNVRLMNENRYLKELIDSYTIDTLSRSDARYNYISSSIINVNVKRKNNFITLNKGLADGVRPDMGVVSDKGVVGVVLTCSRHASLVIPIINNRFRLGVRLKRTDVIASVKWDGKSIDHALLREFPKHEQVRVGDTIVTGFSKIFPQGINVGVIEEETESNDDNFRSFLVKLSTDFKSLSKVVIVDDRMYDDLEELEKNTGL